MTEEFSKEQIQGAADFINEFVNPILLPGMIQLPLFEHTVKNLKERRSDLVSAAAIVGPGYLTKEKEMNFQIKRMEALINLFKTYKETEGDIEEIKDIKKNQDKINKMFGLN